MKGEYSFFLSGGLLQRIYRWPASKRAPFFSFKDLAVSFSPTHNFYFFPWWASTKKSLHLSCPILLVKGHEGVRE